MRQKKIIIDAVTILAVLELVRALEDRNLCSYKANNFVSLNRSLSWRIDALQLAGRIGLGYKAPDY